MNIEFVEIEKNHEETDFCGKTLYRPQIKRNYTLAPKHYKENAIGLFEEHSEEEQNEFNSEIYKGDKIIIIKQIINNKLFVDIEKLEGEEDE